jgi:hypothetical protein
VLATGELTEERFVARVKADLDAFRQWLLGNEQTTIGVTAFAGVSLTEAGQLTLPWGTLRNPSPSKPAAGG